MFTRRLRRDSKLQQLFPIGLFIPVNKIQASVRSLTNRCEWLKKLKNILHLSQRSFCLYLEMRCTLAHASTISFIFCDWDSISLLVSGKLKQPSWFGRELSPSTHSENLFGTFESFVSIASATLLQLDFLLRPSKCSSNILICLCNEVVMYLQLTSNIVSCNILLSRHVMIGF